MSSPSDQYSAEFTFTLTHDEALVLSDFLANFVEVLMEARPEDSNPTAEELVLWKIEGILDPLLVEPFRSDYAELIEKSRKRVVLAQYPDAY